jgi:cytochrome c peroxidase
MLAIRGPLHLLAGVAMAAIANAGSAAAPDVSAGVSLPALEEPITPVPRASGAEPDKVALGSRLFHDPRLSSDDRRSCATCHPLDHGGMDARQRAITRGGTPKLRNTPTIFNVALSSSYNWDGVANTLEAHAELVLLNPDLMGNTGQPCSLNCAPMGST